MTTEKQIWIIDDNEAVCDALKFLFASFFSVNIKIYLNPLQLLQELSPESQGCIIIDLLMHSMNGFELTQKIKARNNRFKIIIVSGYETKKSESQALESGANAFIPKPFQIDNLLNKIKTLLE